MEPYQSRGQRSYRLQPAGDGLGLSCGPEGPTLGPVRLLSKSRVGFAPRSNAELDWVLSHALGRAVTASSLGPRLSIIAEALNAGNLAKAVIATQQMRLGALSETQASRARAAEALVKIDTAHWPAGSPNGRGGQFAPKDQGGSNVPPNDEPAGPSLNSTDVPDPLGEAQPNAAERAVIKNLSRKIIRKALKESLKFLLKDGRIYRYLSELAADEVPIVDVVSGAMTVKDGVELVGEAYELSTEVRAALQFVEHGPHELSEIQVAAKPFQSAPRTMDAFRKNDFTDIKHIENGNLDFEEIKSVIDLEVLEKIYGKPPPGFEYHHIVEQAGRDAGELLHSRDNIVLIPKFLHEEVTAEYARIAEGEVKSLRQKAIGLSFAERYAMGLKALRDVGIIK
jgi:hypothetical protein